VPQAANGQLLPAVQAAREGDLHSLHLRHFSAYTPCGQHTHFDLLPEACYCGIERFEAIGLEVQSREL